MPYFMTGIFFCSFYLMNLVLAVVYLSYELELCSEEKEVNCRLLCTNCELSRISRMGDWRALLC